MNEITLESSVRHLRDKSIIDLVGVIDAFAEGTLREAYQEAEACSPETIVLNFEGVEYINSTGIALIVGLLAEARKSHREMAVFGLSEHYMEIFKITRLADFMNVFEDEKAALEA